MADQVAGGEHFRTTVQKGLEIIQALRGWTSGLPEYVEEINDDEVIFRNFQGQRFTYKQPRPYDGSGTPDIVPIEIAAKKTRRGIRPGRSGNQC